jgi:parallel beta-helix repeat protein
VIEDNTIIGNSNGIFLAASAHGNIIRGNLVAGNPPVQVSVDHPPGSPPPPGPGVDILSLAPAAANTFDGNICLSSVNGPCPALK